MAKKMNWSLIPILNENLNFSKLGYWNCRIFRECDEAPKQISMFSCVWLTETIYKHFKTSCSMDYEHILTVHSWEHPIILNMQAEPLRKLFNGCLGGLIV